MSTPKESWLVRSNTTQYTNRRTGEIEGRIKADLVWGYGESKEGHWTVFGKTYATKKGATAISTLEGIADWLNARKVGPQENILTAAEGWKPDADAPLSKDETPLISGKAWQQALSDKYESTQAKGRVKLTDIN